jgi:hypothetical protein
MSRNGPAWSSPAPRDPIPIVVRRLALLLVLASAALLGAGSPAAWAYPAEFAAPVAAPERPALPVADDVKAALRRALLLGKLSRSDWAWHRRSLWRTRTALRRLGGARRAELGAALANVEGLARAGKLTPSRMPVIFLELRRNLEQWTARRFPHPGERITFGKHPAVFQYYAGRGLHHHPLASFGLANQLARACTAERAAGPRCRPRALRRALDGLLALASRRGDFTAWEYLYAWGGGTAPWVSGMAQATAIQALARGSVALEEPRWAAAAEDALGAFETAPPVGIAAPANPGRHYLMYSFNPQLRILNGFLQTLIGLHDMADLTGSRRAKRLFERGERAARASLAAYDTGAWSRYSRGGRESPLGYHALVGQFLERLCFRKVGEAYCDLGRRFARYEREPTRISVARIPRRRVGRRVFVSFALSKLSTVTVLVRSRRGDVLRKRLALPGGRHVLGAVPHRAGPHRATVVAVAPNGQRSVAVQRFSVKPEPKPVKKKRKRAAERRRLSGSSAR